MNFKDVDQISEEDVLTNSKILFYQTEDGNNRIKVRLEENTVWLTQTLLAELFQTSVPNINLHIKNIYEEGELDQAATIKDYLIVQNEGNRKVKRTVLQSSRQRVRKLCIWPIGRISLMVFYASMSRIFC